MEQLKQPISAVASGTTEFHEETLDAMSRRGQEFPCKVLVSRLEQDGATGLILLMEPDG